MTITITKDGIADTLLFGWMVFLAAFLYIGVLHLETISRCLVIQTEIMVKASAPRQPSILDLLQAPPTGAQEPEDKETTARY